MQTTRSSPIAKARASALASVALLAACTATPPAPQTGLRQMAVWQRHQAMIHYFGLTALYSCDGFENKVRQLLLYLGARPDLKVNAIGCNRAFESPGRLADVNADFYTLAPAGEAAASTVTAQWTSVMLRPMVPMFMGYGDCELVRQVKSVVTRDFSNRDLNYSTACTPHEETVSDYQLRGEFLKPLSSH
jgi:hypothetical protein